MIRTYAWLAAGVIVLALIFGNYGNKIAGAYGEVFRVQLHLDETNANVEALEKRVKELEDMKAIDEERIADLEGRVYSK